MRAERPSAPSRSPRRWLGLAAVAVLTGAAFGAWYLFFRPAGPPPVSLSAVPSSAASSTAGAASSGSLDGAWTVDTSIGSGDAGSFVGYRVQEQLAGIGAATAVGRTVGVSGTFTLAGTKVTAATIKADLTGLRSDDSRRDGQLERRGLETRSFPTAEFTLTEAFDLGSLPASGQVAKATAKGRLTLHGQTRDVTVALEARLNGSVIEVAGSLPIAFADYGIVAPTSMMALSVEDKGVMELQLLFSPS